ncbi:PIN domain-containing protein [Thiomicrospira cyclica]|uniref:PIN domain-containing protein n=1 Tax=Thiomicrospira cyclica TaxID=147268 RepID=UPI000674FFBD|nr:PIN domain-containing protein [Thiomicrospira cyclica]
MLFSKFKDRVEVVDIVSANANLIAKVTELRCQSSLKMPDAIVATTAVVENAVLITSDQKLLRVLGEQAVAFELV